MVALRLIGTGQVQRVAIVDLDVHQGDGNAAILAGHPGVFVFSMHGARNFPFRKHDSDLDVALPDGTEDAAYLHALDIHLPEVFAFRPDIVLYQAGVDPLAEDRLGRLQTEARGLAQLLVGGKRDHPPALDKVRANRGYEAALADALGEDLDAALDARAAAYWGGAEPRPPVWPAGVEPLSDHVQAPDQLAARLAQCGVAPRDQAAELARTLPVGARLATPEGDLFRWDGFVSRAEAPRPAAVRLAQRR